MTQNNCPMKSFFVLVAVSIAVFLGGTATSPSHPVDPTIDNLRAFARLYGYVRFFHPSDEVSAVAWDRFAVYGAGQVKQAATPEALRRTLEALFSPIAPTVQLYPSDTAPPALSPALVPDDTTGLKVIAWQHKGLGFGSASSPYRSIRTHRKNELTPRYRYGVISRGLDAGPYRGNLVRLRAAVKADVQGQGNTAHLMMRVDRPGNERGFFEGMEDRPITAPVWKTYQIEGTVAEDAESVVVGGLLHGQGTAWFDDFRLFVQGADSTWTPVALSDPGFEESEAGAAPGGWTGWMQGYRYSTTSDEAYGGAQSLQVDDEWITDKPLFETRPAVGDVVNKPLGRGLSAQIPLALYSRDGHTLPRREPASFERLSAILDTLDLGALTAEDEALRLGDVVIAWNVFQHFYPYFDVVDTDWDAVLTATLADALDDETTEDFYETLRRLMAALHDGHGRVDHPMLREKAYLPFRVDWIEDQVVVVAATDSTPVRRGDVIVSVDGRPAEALLRQEEALYSGSPQWKRVQALLQFARGREGSDVDLVVRREGLEQSLRVRRERRGHLVEPRPAPLEAVEAGIYYVDLTRVEMTAFEARVEEIARARGVIFDLRGYPNGTHGVLPYLTDRPLRSARWQVPQIIYPDQERLVGYDTTGRWLLPPTQPRLKGEIVFLTDAQAISYAESVMGIVEHYALGEIVGAPTAGANGNVNPFTLPGGFRLSWTGMRVVKHDGSQHHLVGIEPTVPVHRTLEGVREGRDEYLETALALIRDGTRTR